MSRNSGGNSASSATSAPARRSQDEYLAIVAQWLRALGLDEEGIRQARPEALVWALERGSRSGRVAWQFARDRVGRDEG